MNAFYLVFLDSFKLRCFFQIIYLWDCPNGSHLFSYSDAVWHSFITPFYHHYWSEIIKNAFLIPFNYFLFAFIIIDLIFILPLLLCYCLYLPEASLLNFLFLTPFPPFPSKEKQGAIECCRRIVYCNSSSLVYWIMEVAQILNKFWNPSTGI